MTPFHEVDDDAGTRPRVVDCHSHVLPRAYLERLGRLAEADPVLEAARRASTPEGMSRLPHSCARYMLGGLESRLELMAEVGLDRQVLSAGSALAFPIGAERRAELVTAWNDAVHDEIMGSSRPSAFGMFASVPLPDVAAAIRETRRVMRRGTTAGFSTTAHILGEPLDGGQWDPLFEVWNQLRATVFVHPDRFRVRGLMPAHTEVDAGTQFDDTLVTLQLIGPDLGAKFPDIRWIVPHLGGAFPFLLERLDEHWDRDQHLRPGSRRPSGALSNIWFDTAGHGNSAVRFAVEALGAHRFILGSDFPMLGDEQLDVAVQRVQHACADADGVARMLGGTAQEVLMRLGVKGQQAHQLEGQREDQLGDGEKGAADGGA